LTLIAVSVSRQRREIGFAQSSAKRSQNALFSFFQDSSRRLANIFGLLAKVLRVSRGGASMSFPKWADLIERARSKYSEGLSRR
jgi:hypothetical protein